MWFHILYLTLTLAYSYFEYGCVSRFCAWFVLWLFELSFWFCLSQNHVLFLHQLICLPILAFLCVRFFHMAHWFYDTHTQALRYSFYSIQLMMHSVFGNRSKVWMSQKKNAWFVLENEATEIRSIELVCENPFTITKNSFIWFCCCFFFLVSSPHIFERKKEKNTKNIRSTQTISLLYAWQL